MEDMLISIIVPVYNVEMYLDACVESIINQTYTNWELLLINDGSKDRSPELCDRWSEADSRIKVIHKTNGGASSARNVGLDHAQGDYIGFIDSDDYISKTMFEDLLLALRDAKAGIAQCGAYRVWTDGTCHSAKEILQKGIYGVEDAVKAIFYRKISTSMCTKLFKRSVLDGIRFPEGEVNEEFPVLIPIVKRAGCIVCIPKDLYYYRAREGSVTSLGYSQERNSDIVYRNLERIRLQLETYQLNCQQAFRYFSADFSYSWALSMEKSYRGLSDKVKADYQIYRKIMKENLIVFLCSPHSKIKDKILYLLVVTRFLRPVYKIFYRKHLL